MYKYLFPLILLGSCISSNDLKTESEPTSQKEGLVLMDGKALFQENCASCHHPLKDGTGPALVDLHEKHSIQWIHKFLTDRKKLEKESILKHTLRINKESDCLQFPNMTIEQVDAILHYTGGCLGLPKTIN